MRQQNFDCARKPSAQAAVLLHAAYLYERIKQKTREQVSWREKSPPGTSTSFADEFRTSRTSPSISLQPDAGLGEYLDRNLSVRAPRTAVAGA